MKRLLPFLFAIFTATASRAALVYVGGTTGFGNDSNFSIDLTALTGGIASAPATGDIVIVVDSFVSVGDYNAGVLTDGYTELTDLYANDSWDSNLAVSWKIMGATPDTTVSCVAGASRGSVGLVQVWRNVDQVTPIDSVIGTATGINGGFPDGPATTPVTSGAVVITAGMRTGAIGDASVTAPSGYGNLVQKTYISTLGTTAGIASKIWSGSGAEDPGVWSDWYDEGANILACSWAAVTLALRPAAGDAVPSEDLGINNFPCKKRKNKGCKE